MTNSQTAQELRTIPLSAIVVADGFNPRVEFDKADLDRLTQSIKDDGLLQPLLVAPAVDGEYQLVDGERRYRACIDAALVEVPVLIRSTDAETHGLEYALVANSLRVDLNPVEEAQAFKRLIEHGLTRRGVAEKYHVTQKYVTERMRILELPQALYPSVADGTIPPSAIKALVEVAKVHPGLAELVVARVGAEPREQWDEPVTWADALSDPIGVATGRSDDDAAELPAGVFDSDVAYPLSAFTLSEKAAKDTAKLCELRGVDPKQFGIRFGREEVEHAQKLGAAFPADRLHNVVIVGQELADELVADVVKRALKNERARVKREREWEAQRVARGASASGSEPAAGLSEDELKEQRRAQREADAEARRQACAFNDELGIAIVKTLSKTKVDERVVKILAAVDFDGELDKLAMRGARYGFPGWVEEITVKEGKPVKRVYLESREADERARAYLGAAKTASEYAGRLLALVTMAHLADEGAVVQSRRSFYSLSFGSYHSETLPWSREVLALIEEIALERLPEHLTERLRERKAEREAEEAQERAEAEAREAAIAELRERLPEIPASERNAAVFALQDEHGWHSAFSELHGEVRRLEQAEAAAALESDPAPGDEPEPEVDAEADVEADDGYDEDEVLEDAFAGADYDDGGEAEL